MITFSRLGTLGRLGNQLFQIATTISTALKHNDTYIFPPWDQEQHFNLHNCFSFNTPVAYTYDEPHFHYKEIPYMNNMDLNGYFQSEKYFQEHESLIRALLSPRRGVGIKWGTTSIHVRKGDYISLNDCYEQLTMLYYDAAMRVVNSSNYLVFSDDINWCKRHFIGPQFAFAEHNEPHIDLALMLSCENNIIANSSFSWWGAYLNKNPSKKVIAPAKWFGPKLPHSTMDLLPKNWITV